MGPALRAKLLTADGSLARMLGDFSRAAQLLERATGIWRDLAVAEGLAWALSHLGLVKQWLGQLDTGVQLLEESLALRLPSEMIAESPCRSSTWQWPRTSAATMARAAQLYEQTLEVQRRVGDTWELDACWATGRRSCCAGGARPRREFVPRGAQAEQPGCRQMANWTRAVRHWRCRMDAIPLRQSLRVAQAEPLHFATSVRETGSRNVCRISRHWRGNLARSSSRCGCRLVPIRSSTQAGLHCGLQFRRAEMKKWRQHVFPWATKRLSSPGQRGVP